MDKFFIQCLKSEKIQSNLCHGRFLLYCLKPGQGITIGNLLRRVLLGDLGGVAISGVYIAGSNYEFATIKDVKEDVLEILLNLKKVVFKGQMKEIQTGRLNARGPQVVTADLIELPKELKVVNPNHYIATVSDGGELKIQLKFDYGVGYKLANQSQKNAKYLDVDAIFMPVQKVDFKVESVYQNNNVITERLLLEVWTNGSIMPDEAIRLASKKIVHLFSILVNETNDDTTIRPPEKKPVIQKISYNDIIIEELELSVRSYNCLKKAQINSIGDLLKYSAKELRGLKNFGQKSANEVFRMLKSKMGIVLK